MKYLSYGAGIVFMCLVASTAISQDSNEKVIDDISDLEKRLNQYAADNQVSGPTRAELEASLKTAKAKVEELTTKLKACEARK